MPVTDAAVVVFSFQKRTGRIGSLLLLEVLYAVRGVHFLTMMDGGSHWVIFEFGGLFDEVHAWLQYSLIYIPVIAHTSPHKNRWTLEQ